MMMLEAWQKLLSKEASIQDQEIIIASPVKSSAYKLFEQVNHPLLKYQDLDINDPEALASFIEESKPSAIGFEIESISSEGLKATKSMPSTQILEMIQDKGKQKQWYRDHGISTANFKLFDSVVEIETKPPFVIKTRSDGYDGRGVAIVKSEQELASVKIPGSVLVEDLVDIATELAVIVVRNPKGNLVTYPTVEMFFDKENQLEALTSPTINIPEDINQEAQNITKEIAEKLELEGILAIEFIYSKSGELYVNEMAPRTHNSGHHSIEAYNCSQFEQYLRVLLGLDLIEPKPQAPAAAIFNIVGVADFEGEAELDKSKLSDASNSFFHWYQKSNRYNRKLGHLTVLAKDPSTALDKARKLGKELNICPIKLPIS